MKRHKIVLLADGSEEFRWLVWKSSREHTYFSMKTVGSGWDVLRCIQKQPPDLLLIDTALPDICGLTVLKELERQGNVPKTIVLSSVVSERMAEKARSLGAAHFLPKPFHTEALFDLIYMLLHGYPQYPPLMYRRAAGDQLPETLSGGRFANPRGLCLRGFCCGRAPGKSRETAVI